MLVIGLTGGIGSGKSTVASLLAIRGAEVIDVDALGRAVLEPDGGAYAAVVATFGEEILDGDGMVDRAALGREVFGAGSRLAELEAISHPAINRNLAKRLEATSAAVVVLDMAVLAESRLGWAGEARLYQRVVVVEAPVPVRLERLVERGMSEKQAGDRMAAQATDEQRRLLADVVIPNAGSIADLENQLDALWPSIEAWALQAGELAE
ncbi:MAG: dephospho-CoA kinase [Acidimicrobiales bacterium]